MPLITKPTLANRGKRLPRLVLALALVLGSRGLTAQSTQTINLNTGYNQGISTLIPFLQPDTDWQVIEDPIKQTVPRPSNVVNNIPATGHLKWPPPVLNSQGKPSRWISPDANRYYGSLPPPRTVFHYQVCFNLPSCFSAPKLKLQLRADDIINMVRLNNAFIFEEPDRNADASPTKLGSFRGAPLAISYENPTGFRAGRNCLQVVTEDVQQFITGLNVAGSVTYEPVVPPPPCVLQREFVVDLSTGTKVSAPVDVAPGQVDPKWSLVSGPAFAQPDASKAYVTNPHPGWLVLNSTQPANWIQRKGNVSGQEDQPGLYMYRVEFCLYPSEYNNLQLTLRFSVDNDAVVKLNNQQISFCNGDSPPCFKVWRPTVAGITVSGPFVSGLNKLEVVVTNRAPATDPSWTGVIVDAKLTGICKRGGRLNAPTSDQ